MSVYFTPEQYRQWQWIWTPFFPTHSGLFLVRYPGDLLQMPMSVYQSLIKTRLNCLIDEWMAETQESQKETHYLLCQMLKVLNPIQEPPPMEDLWAWREAWADSMIEFNETFLARLSQHPLDRQFPVPMHPPIPSEQEQLQPLHDEMMLYDWLSELTGEDL